MTTWKQRMATEYDMPHRRDPGLDSLFDSFGYQYGMLRRVFPVKPEPASVTDVETGNEAQD